MTRCALVFLLAGMAALASGCSVLDGPVLSTGTEAPVASVEVKPGLPIRPTLSEVLSLLESRSPTLGQMRHRAQAAAMRAEQADRPPNPSVSGGPMFGFGGPMVDIEGGASVSQTIEIGKRGPRVREALAEHQASVAEFKSVSSDLVLEATLLFNEILALQETVLLNAELAKLAEAVERLSKKSEAAGGSSRESVIQAGVAAADARRAARSRRSDLETACRRLEALLDLGRGSVAGVTGRLHTRPPLPKIDDLRRKVGEGNAAVALACARTAAARELEDRERAGAIPDVTVGASWAHRTGSDGAMEMAGLSIGFPVPLLDARRAAVAAARSGISASVEAERAAVNAALAELETALEEFANAADRGRVQSREVVPGLESLLALTLKAREAGRSSEMDVIARRADLVRARLDAIGFMRDAEDALARAAHAVGSDSASIFRS